MALDSGNFRHVIVVLVCAGGFVMKVSVNTFKVLLKIAAIGEVVSRKDITNQGADTYIVENLSRLGLIESAEGKHQWRITDKAYREITEIEKLVEQVK